MYIRKLVLCEAHTTCDRCGLGAIAATEEQDGYGNAVHKEYLCVYCVRYTVTLWEIAATGQHPDYPRRYPT